MIARRSPVLGWLSLSISVDSRINAARGLAIFGYIHGKTPYIILQRALDYFKYSPRYSRTDAYCHMYTMNGPESELQLHTQ